MGKILCIAEKPSVARDIARVLKVNGKKDGYFENDDYIVSWAVGHLVGLKQPEEIKAEYKQWSLEPLPFKFDYDKSLKVLDGTKKQFEILKILINRKDVSLLVNCGDAGREGYLVQELIYQMAGNTKPKKVLWISSFTDEALIKGFNKLHDAKEFDGIYEEAKARSWGDYAYGIGYTRALTCSLGNGSVLRYGRCQTPLLYLLAKREEEIQNFKSTPYYEINAEFNSGFTGTMFGDSFKDKSEAEKVVENLKGKSGVVKEFKCEDKQTAAPTLFSIDALQVEMGKKFKFAPDKTLEIAQALYEKYKVTTYPRTDSNVIPDDVWNEIDRHIASVLGVSEVAAVKSEIKVPAKPEKRYVNNGKVTDHHAIIPTINDNVLAEMKNMTDDEKNVFIEICKRFISIFLPNYKYKASEMVIGVGDKEFKSSGNMVVDLGWKKLYKDADSDAGTLLPQMKEGDEVGVKEMIVVDKMTKAPARYNVSSITSLQKAHHLGTQATMPEFPVKLEKAGYIKLEKGKYFVTPLGMEYIKLIPDELKTDELAANFDEKLKQVNSGEMGFHQFQDIIYAEQKEMIEKFKTMEKMSRNGKGNCVGICPLCGKPVYENSKAYGCSGYKNGCKFTIWKTIAGKSITPNQASEIIEKGETSKPIKGFKKKDGSGTYDAYLMRKEDGSIGFRFGK